MVKAIYTYDGVMFDSLSTLAKATNVEKSAYFCEAYYQRKCLDLDYLVKYYGGTEHIDKSNVITDKNGCMFYTKRAMKTYYSLYLHKDLSDVENDILETILNNYNAISSLTSHELKTERIKGIDTLDKVFTYKGYHYKNYAVFCSIYGIDLVRFDYFRSVGYDMDTIMHMTATKKWDDNKIKHTDYTGYNKFYNFYRNKSNVFLSREEMCNHWNISEDVFMQRVTHGISVGIALSTPLVEYFSDSIKIGDFTYDNLYDLCEAYKFDLNFMYLFKRLRNNRRIDDILPKRLVYGYNSITGLNRLKERKERESVEPKPEKKREMSNVNFKCSVREYNLRRRLGLTHEESFDVTFKDPFDKTFDKVKDMCECYGVSPKCLQRLVNLGLDLKNALNQSKSDVADHRGIMYKNYNEMARNYGLTQEIVIYRLSHGWSLQEALEIPISEK